MLHAFGGSPIDEMVLTVMPTILGAGPVLFPNGTRLEGFKLVATQSYATGAVQLTYKISRPDSLAG